MKQFNDNTVIATGKEINDSGLFPHIQPNDTEVLLWIKWTWGLVDNRSNFAPIVYLFTEIQDNTTHKISDEPFYFTLPKNINGEYMFEAFISRYIPIERI